MFDITEFVEYLQYSTVHFVSIRFFMSIIYTQIGDVIIVKELYIFERIGMIAILFFGNDK